MTFSHHAFVGLALLAVGCAAEQEDADAASQDVVGTFKNYSAEKAAERIVRYYLPERLYQGKTPDGDDCTLTVARDDDNHLVAVSMGVFPKSGYETIGFEVHPEIPSRDETATAVTNWADKTIALDFDVKFADDAGDVDAHVSMLAPKHVTTSLAIASGDRSFTCAELTVTRTPMK